MSTIRQNRKAGNERKYNRIYATGLMVKREKGRSDNREWWKHELTQGKWF